MMRRFDEQLKELSQMMLEMGALVEKSINLASDALKAQDVELAKKVIVQEDEIDALEKDIEALCVRLLLQQQPVAKDLRLITSALKMITDLERIGDQAADISEIIIMMGNLGTTAELAYIPEMAQATVKMVTQSVDAFVRSDLDLAHSVIEYDDVVDSLFDKMKFDLIERIRSNSPDSVQAVDLLMIAKYYERIGDHATNVAGWVVYSITGEQV